MGGERGIEYVKRQWTGGYKPVDSLADQECSHVIQTKQEYETILDQRNRAKREKRGNRKSRCVGDIQSKTGGGTRGRQSRTEGASADRRPSTAGGAENG